MKKLLLCLIALALFSNSAAAQRKLNERRAVVPNGFIRIFTLNGSVTVVGWDKDSLAVTGAVWESAGNQFSIGITPKGAKLGLWNDIDQSSGPGSHITVHVPLRSQVWVKTTGADVKVGGVTGGIDVFSVSGSIEVAGAPREVYTETMGGDIVLNATTSAARIKTAGGALRVRGSVSDLTAVTVSGPIDVSMLRFERARIESVDGDIRYAGSVPPGSGLAVTNHAGAIELVVPSNTNADFVVSVYSGEFVEDFGIRKKLGADRTKGRELTFAVGEKPTARITLRSFKGKISVRKS